MIHIGKINKIRMCYNILPLSYLWIMYFSINGLDKKNQVPICDHTRNF